MELISPMPCQRWFSQRSYIYEVGLLPVDWLREVKLCPVITNFYSKIKIKRSQHSTEF